MYSLNIPVPPTVKRTAETFRPLLGTAMTDTYTLVAKRLDTDDTPQHTIEKRIRTLLADGDPFTIRITGIDCFRNPTTGSGTVLYLALESPELHTLHSRLCTIIPAAPRVEGDEYTPHITIARTADETTVTEALNRTIDQDTWTVSSLVLYDAATTTQTGTISLTS